MIGRFFALRSGKPGTRRVGRGLICALWALWSLSASACSFAEGYLPFSTPTPAIFTQWAIEARASSQYGYPDWSASRATGAAQIEACADDSRAWASARGNGVEWLELVFPELMHVTEVRVYQNYGRGAISRLTLIDENGERDVIWEGTELREPCPGVMRVSLVLTPYRTQILRIDLDESRTGYWNQIDAVEMIGLR